MAQSDLGSAAVKIGGSVLSGMKSLGGLAFSAAKAGVSAAVSGEFNVSGSSAVPPTPTASSSGRLFSRSAPEASASTRDSDVRTSGDGGSSPPWEAGSHISAPSPPSRSSVPLLDSTSSSSSPDHSGSYVTVLDLAPLRSSTFAQAPVPVAEFLVSKQPVCDLTFSQDGVSLITSPRDGQNIRVFQIRPVPRPLRQLQSALKSGGKEGKGVGAGKGQAEASYSSPWHVYELHRGRTSGVIQRVESALDGRWLGVGTKKGTIHVFAVNPYGGAPDERSHLEGRVVNTTQLVSSFFMFCVSGVRLADIVLSSHCQQKFRPSREFGL